MNNTITSIIPKILARGMMALRSTVLMTRLVNLDYSTEAKAKGETIDVPISSAMTTSSVTAGPTPPDPDDTTVSTVQIPLDNWEHASFGLKDDELAKIDADANFIPLQMMEAFEAMATSVNQSIFSEYKGVYGYVGTAGTVPFGSGVLVESATGLRKVLNQQRCPKGNRAAVLDWDAEAAALGLSAFSDAEKVGASDVKIEGEIGRKFGINWNADDDTPTHTAGTITTGLTVTAEAAAGLKSVGCTVAASTGACALLEGDIVTFAGDTQTYVLTANVTGVAGAAVVLPIEPALKVTLEAAAAVAVKASHVVNLGFHRDAFALAMRAPDASLKGAYANPNSFTMGDPVSGLVFRLELIRQYKQWMWDIDCLWGAKLVKRELAGRLAG